MSSKANKAEKKQEQTMMEIAFISPVVAKGKEIFGEITEAKHILEYGISQAEMVIKLEEHKIDKNGNRYAPDGKLISKKGSKERPEPEVKAGSNNKEESER